MKTKRNIKRRDHTPLFWGGGGARKNGEKVKQVSQVRVCNIAK